MLSTLLRHSTNLHLHVTVGLLENGWTTAGNAQLHSVCAIHETGRKAMVRLFTVFITTVVIDKGKRGIGNGSKIMFGSVPRMTS